MFTDTTLKIGNFDLTGKTLTYEVERVTEFTKVVTTLDGTEYASRQGRDVIRFTVFPMTDEQTAMLYTALSPAWVQVRYTSPYAGKDVTAWFRMTSGIDSVFGIRSIDGNRYYRGGTIELRRRDIGTA